MADSDRHRAGTGVDFESVLEHRPDNDVSLGAGVAVSASLPKRVEEFIPELHLKGVSSDKMGDTLKELFGDTARDVAPHLGCNGLSAQ